VSHFVRHSDFVFKLEAVVRLLSDELFPTPILLIICSILVRSLCPNVDNFVPPKLPVKHLSEVTQLLSFYLVCFLGDPTQRVSL